MIETITLHHEDWDFNKIFADLYDRGVRQVKVRIPPEWQETEAIKLQHAKNLIIAAQNFKIEIVELVDHDSGTAIKKRVDGPAGMDVSGGRKVNFKLILFILLVVLVLASLISGGIFLSRQAFDQRASGPAISPLGELPEARATATPTSVPTPVLDRRDLTLRVLNGSGRRGVAGEAAERLKKLGYTIVKTGNASTYDYPTSVLRLKPTGEWYRNLLVADLEGEYEISSGSALPADDTAGGELIIGER